MRRNLHDKCSAQGSRPLSLTCPVIAAFRTTLNPALANIKKLPLGSVYLYGLLFTYKLRLNDITGLAAVYLTDHLSKVAHKIRERRIAERTTLVNQVRGLLMVYGVIVPLGIHKLRADLPPILGDAENELSIIARQQFQLLLEDWQALDILISEQDILIKRQAHADEKPLD